MANKQRVSKRGLRSQQFAAATHVLWNPLTAMLGTNRGQTWLPPLTGRQNRPGELLQGLRAHFLLKTPTYTQPRITWKWTHSPLTYGVLVTLKERDGIRRLGCRHNTTQHTANTRQFPAAMSTMLGTRCGVSVVSGWTPHPDTWQTVLSRLCRNTAGFWRCSRLLWLTLWIQECC